MDRDSQNKLLARLTAYRMQFDDIEDDLHKKTLIDGISPKDRAQMLSELAALHSRIEVLVKELQDQRAAR